jgi:hypothetical protein
LLVGAALLAVVQEALVALVAEAMAVDWALLMLVLVQRTQAEAVVVVEATHQPHLAAAAVALELLF